MPITTPPTPTAAATRRIAAAAIVLIALPALVGTTPVEARTRATNAEYGPVDAASPLRSGRVVDLTRGVDGGARERHLLRGATPDAEFSIVGDIHGDAACASAAIPVAEGVVRTDERGNGSTVVLIPPDALATAPPVFWVRWRLVDDGRTTYETACTPIEVER